MEKHNFNEETQFQWRNIISLKKHNFNEETSFQWRNIIIAVKHRLTNLIGFHLSFRDFRNTETKQLNNN